MKHCYVDTFSSFYPKFVSKNENDTRKSYSRLYNRLYAYDRLVCYRWRLGCVRVYCTVCFVRHITMYGTIYCTLIHCDTYVGVNGRAIGWRFLSRGEGCQNRRHAVTCRFKINHAIKNTKPD